VRSRNSVILLLILHYFFDISITLPPSASTPSDKSFVIWSSWVDRLSFHSLPSQLAPLTSVVTVSVCRWVRLLLWKHSLSSRRPKPLSLNIPLFLSPFLSFFLSPSLLRTFVILLAAVQTLISVSN